MKKYRQNKNYFFEGIEQNEQMSKRHKKVVSAFHSLFGIPIDITSSIVGSKIRALTVEIKKYKSIIKKKGKKIYQNGIVSEN